MFKAIQSLFKGIRNDGWTNVVTNLGTSNSRTNSTLFKPTLALDQYTLAEIYKSNGIGKRIVNIVVDDAARGFIEGDALLIDELQRAQTKQKIIDAGSFGRLYGGAILVAFIDDGLEMHKPLNLNRINKLVSLKVFDRHQIQWTNDDLCRDFYKEHYGEPEVFTITSVQNYMADNNSFFKVHRSRCFIFGGERLVNTAKLYNQGWDVSVLQSCYEAIRNYGIVVNSSAEIVQDFIQVLMKMNGLSDKLIQEGGDAEIIKRMQWIDLSRSNANTILLDGDGSEDYEKKSSSVAGLAELWDRFSENICAVTGIPATRLFGKSPAGLNATGTSDMQNWYDIVRAYRGDQIEPCLKWLIDILKNQKSWTKKPTNWEWEFPSLTAPSEGEWADIKKKYAEIDCMYIDRGAIEPSECWQERFGQGSFQTNITLAKPDNELLEIDEGNEDLLEDDVDIENDIKKEEDKKITKVMYELYNKVKGTST